MAIPLSTETYIGSLESDLAKIDAAAATASGGKPVPGCGDWKVDDLVLHLAQVWTYATANVRLGGERAERSVVVQPDETTAAQWQTLAGRALVETLRETDPATKTWQFEMPDATVADWCRRTCNEAAVHRYDMQRAVAGTGAGSGAGGSDGADGAEPIKFQIAADSIDEFLDVFLAVRNQGAFAGNGETLHLHATDSPATDGPAAAGTNAGEWFIIRTADGIEVERKHDKADAAARAPASDLLLFMWGRIPPAALEVFGDGGLLDEWQDKVRF